MLLSYTYFALQDRLVAKYRLQPGLGEDRQPDCCMIELPEPRLREGDIFV